IKVHRLASKLTSDRLIVFNLIARSALGTVWWLRPWISRHRSAAAHGSARSATVAGPRRCSHPVFVCGHRASTSIRAGTDLFGRDVRRCLGEIGRTLLEEGCKCLLRFCGAHSFTELSHFGCDGRSDLVDESPLEESLAGPQCAAWFCCELLRGFGCCREQVLVRHYAGHEPELRRPRGIE